MHLRQAIIWSLLTALLAAALVGLVLVFVGGQDDVLKVLLSVLIFAGVLVLALPAQLHPRPWLQVAVGALCAADAVIAWVLIWGAGDSAAADALGRTAGMITALLVVVGVALVLTAMVRGPHLRPSRIAAWVSHATGAALLVMVWLLILTDGEVPLPGRVVAGIAIIYVASSLTAMLVTLMRRYRVVPREPG